MLESDYLALDKSGVKIQNEKNASETQELGKQVVRELIIPILEKEVNEGKNLSQLRQVYHSLILATWYKRKIKKSLLGQAYVDQQKTAGIEKLIMNGESIRREGSDIPAPVHFGFLDPVGVVKRVCLHEPVNELRGVGWAAWFVT